MDLAAAAAPAPAFNFDSFTITASKTVMAARQQTRNNGRRLLRFTKKLTSAKSPHKRRLLAKKLMTLSAKRFNLQGFARTAIQNHKQGRRLLGSASKRWSVEPVRSRRRARWSRRRARW